MYTVKIRDGRPSTSPPSSSPRWTSVHSDSQCSRSSLRTQTKTSYSDASIGSNDHVAFGDMEPIEDGATFCDLSSSDRISAPLDVNMTGLTGTNITVELGERRNGAVTLGIILTLDGVTTNVLDYDVSASDVASELNGLVLVDRRLTGGRACKWRVASPTSARDDASARRRV